MLGIALALFQMSGVATAYAGAAEECPGYWRNPAFKKTMDYYGYRLKPQIHMHGCDVILVYHALGNGYGAGLDLAEEDPDLMGRLVQLFRVAPGSSEILNRNPRFMQALDAGLRDDAARNALLSSLERLDAEQIDKSFPAWQPGNSAACIAHTWLIAQIPCQKFQ